MLGVVWCEQTSVVGKGIFWVGMRTTGGGCVMLGECLGQDRHLCRGPKDQSTAADYHNFAVCWMLEGKSGENDRWLQ